MLAWGPRRLWRGPGPVACDTKYSSRNRFQTSPRQDRSGLGVWVGSKLLRASLGALPRCHGLPQRYQLLDKGSVASFVVVGPRRLPEVPAGADLVVEKAWPGTLNCTSKWKECRSAPAWSVVVALQWSPAPRFASTHPTHHELYRNDPG